MLQVLFVNVSCNSDLQLNVNSDAFLENRSEFFICYYAIYSKLMAYFYSSLEWKAINFGLETFPAALTQFLPDNVCNYCIL